MELKGRTSIGWRIARRVFDCGSGREFTAAEMARLSRSDRLRIDLGGIVRGLNALREEAPKPRPAALIIAVSFSSLSNLDGRTRIVEAFQEAQKYARLGVISELSEIDGVPATTLMTSVAMIRPFSLFVIGHALELMAGHTRTLKDAGFQGISMTCPARLEGAAFVGWAKGAVATAKEAARSVLIYHLQSEHQVQFVTTLGATHASVMSPVSEASQGIAGS